MEKDNLRYELLYKEFNRYLEEHQLKRTPERFAILKMVYTQEKPFEVKTIERKFKNKRYYISKATLYNTIHLLEECNIIEKTFIENKIMYRQKKLEAEHILISKEGKTTISIDEKIEKMLIEWVEKQYQINIKHFNTTFYTEE